MANLTPVPGWDAVPQLEITTPVLGGPGGVANAQAQALVNRLEAMRGTGSGQGASLVGVQDAGAFLAATTVEAALQEIAKNNDDHEGLLNYGTQAGATAALTAAATALSSGGTVYLKGGTWTLPTAFSTAVWRFSIVGQGKNVTNFLFTPGATATALKFDAGGGSGYNENAVRYIGFSGGADTSAKTAIEYVNAANCEIQGVAIATGSWLGDSIGVKASGRQLLRITDSKFACARPIVYAQNTYFTSLNVDHFLLENSELVGTSATRPCVEFSDGCAFSNMTIRNVAIVQGQDGILWNDTSSTAASFALSLQNIRIEQGLDTSAWGVRLESTAQALQTLTLDNVHFDSTRNGLKLRNAHYVSLRNCNFTMSSAKTAIDMTFVAGSRLLIENCRFGVNKVLTQTNARLIRTEKNTSGTISAEYVFDAGAAASMIQFGVPIGGSDISITTAGTATINDQNFSGFVFIVHSGRVSAIFACTGTSLTTIEVADPSARYSITATTANSNNLYYSGNNLTLENRDPAAATLTYNVIFLGRSTA